jgi:hypothetical protein
MNKEAGVLSGVVRWTGVVPAEEPLAQALFVSVGGTKVPVKALPRLQVHEPDGGVGGVAVWLVKPPDATALPPEPIHLTQSHGHYHPHIQVVRQGGQLELRSADDKANFQGSGAASFSARLDRGGRLSFTLGQTGLVEVRSELLPGVRPAYIHVLDHSYYAVTDKEGRFHLPNVPPGEYHVVLWHEGWRSPAPVRVQVGVKLASGEGAAIQWTLSNP